MGVKWAASNIPRSDKSSDGGDDAWFTLDHSAAGVADGVGSWRAKGVNAGKFARQLMNRVSKEMDTGGAVNPYKALTAAFAQPSKLGGSTTALIVNAVGQQLYVCQLGDSGMIIIRNGRCVYASDEQEHFFDTPYQLGNNNDTPSDAFRYVIPIQDNDTIVLGTDGLFNNLYIPHIVNIVNNFPLSDDGKNLESIVTALVDEAFAKSQTSDYWSPFAQRGYVAGIHQAFDLKVVGGKPDDITCVVGRVSGVGLL
jgi:protein phosphatase PTC7